MEKSEQETVNSEQPRAVELGARMGVMDDFPRFMKHDADRIATANNATPGVEGYVFDGADGSQMAFWTCGQSASSSAHAHEFDEYMVVVQGSIRSSSMAGTFLSMPEPNTLSLKACCTGAKSSPELARSTLSGATARVESQ